MAERGSEESSDVGSNPTSTTKQYHRERNLRRRYGLTQAAYKLLEKAQNARCAICDLKTPGKNLHVDHSHVTGLTRGLLCSNCNRGLGLLGDSIKNLRSAIKYLGGASGA